MVGYLKKTLFVSCGFLIFSLVFQGGVLPPRNAWAVEQISLGTATVGGMFCSTGNSIAQCLNKALPEINVTAEFTEGSVENLRLIKKKEMQLAVITPMIGYYARKGIRMFKNKPVHFRVVVRLMPTATVWTTLSKNKDIGTIYDMKGQRVGVGTGGLGVVARMQLAAHGIDVKRDIKPFFLQAGALATALKDGNVDASCLTKDLARMVSATHQIKILSWQEKDLNAFVGKNPYFGKYVYPAGTFRGIDSEILTVDSGMQLVCHANMSNDMVFKLTKAISEHLDCMSRFYAPAKVLSKKWLASELGNPFHPGAISYFKEAGLWKKQ